MDSSATRPAHRSRSLLPHAPLLLLTASLVLASAPIRDQAPSWTAALLAVCCLTRMIVNFRHLPLPALGWRFLLLAGAIVGILLSYGTFLGVEPGFGVLLVLVSLKVLETNSVRDFVVLMLLGYFLGLCGLFFSQEMNRWLYVGLTTTLLTTGMVHLHFGGAPRALGRSLRLAGGMLFQALPLVLLLFLFCPRPRGEFRLFLGSSALGSAGMSDHLQPGSISGVAMGLEEAFRVRFDGGAQPPPQGRYWRSVVLWTGEGMVWDRWDRRYPALHEYSRDPGLGPALPHHIILRPHGGHWLVALDRPVDTPKIAETDSGGTLRSYRAIMTRTSYEVTSRPLSGETILPRDQREAALRRPEHVSAEVQALATSFRAGAADEREVAERALEYFRHGFTYSLEPGRYESPALDEFLFQRKAGFCEHYAAAFATLMRLAGVPSRIVCGYLGGEYNQMGGYFLVRQSDAHAWCEVWVTGRGWLRIDPTSVTAPGRISEGLQNFLASHAAGTGKAGEAAGGNRVWSNLARESAMFWDNLSYQWDVRVLTYNAESQQSFFAALGLGHWQVPQIAAGLVGAGALLLGALVLWLRRHTEPGDPAQRSYRAFCRRAAAAGCAARPGEAPLSFTRRAAERFPRQAREIEAVGEVYSNLRYSREMVPAEAVARAVRRVGRLKKSPAGVG